MFDMTKSQCLLYFIPYLFHEITHSCLIFQKVLSACASQKGLTVSDKHIKFRSCCPHVLCCCVRWRVDPWSPCSASCGGGSQIRSVHCMKGPEGRAKEVGSHHCLGTGRRPADSRPCNQLPCARWATTLWGLVSLLTLLLTHLNTPNCVQALAL